MQVLAKAESERDEYAVPQKTVRDLDDCPGLEYFPGCGQSKTSKSANANSSQNIAQMGFVVQKDDWVYYLLLNSEEGKLYLHKVKTDGSENQPLFATDPVAISAFSVYGDWIYYQPMKAGNAEKEPIWRKMKLDGTQNAEFADLGSGGINFDGDWIYYGAAGAEPSGFSKPDFPLTRMKLDGSEQSEIAADDASYIYIYDDMIYFVSLQFSMEAGLALAINKVKKDGTGKEVLVKTAETTSSDEGNFTPDDSAPVENPENQPIKLEALAELNNAVVGELNKAYAYSSSDGSGSIGFASIETFTDDYNDGKNTYSNAVVIKLVGEEVYYHVLEFYFFDQNGKLFRESMTTIGKSDHSMLFSGDDANLADFVAYIMILGLDASQNDGKRKVIFEVSSGTN